MVVSVTQIAAYDQTKASLEGKLDGLALHAASGVAAAFIFCTASMPFDTVKTRKQQAVKASAGQLSSAAAGDSTFGAIARVRREEGLAALWNGYPPYLASKGLLTVLLFIIKEKYTVWALQAVGLPAPVSEFVTKH
jgi:Mitochondrial carrier protein